MSNIDSLLDAPGDWSLKILVSLTNDSPIRLPVTLTVSAGMVSGTLASEAEFFDGIAAGLADNWPGGGNESIRTMFSALNEPGMEPPAGYVHLKNAYLVTPSGHRPVGYNGLWRGDLSAVVGYSIGSFSIV